MPRLLAAVVVLAAATACAASAAQGPPVRLDGPRTAAAGSRWTATIRVTPASLGRPTLTARGPGRPLTVRGVAAGPGRWRVSLRFAAAGRWTLSARVGTRRFALGAVTVRASVRPLTFREPGALAVAPDGSLVLAVQGEGRLVRIDPGSGAVSTIARVSRPWGVAVAPDGAVLFTAGGDVMRREPDGRTTALARFPVESGPVSVAPGGDVFVGVSDHRVYRIRGGTVEPYAGSGPLGSSGDGGPALAAELSSPHGFAFPADGSLLLSDTGNDSIRRVDGATTVITTYAADVVVPNGIALAPDGGLYVTESQGHRVTRIDLSGRRETVAGTGVAGSTGDGGPARRARLDVPTQVALGAGGELYLVEWRTGRIRVVRPDGTIATLARRVG